MDGFTLIDGVVAAVIVLSALLAYSRGFVREGLAIAAWIGAAILAFLFAPTVEPLIKELPVIGGFIGDSCELAIITAFALVVAGTLIVFSLFTPLFSALVQRSIFGGLDQGLGFLFGVLRGILLVAVGYFVYDVVLVGQEIAMVDDSRSARVFTRLIGTVENQDPEAALNWITTQYETLVAACNRPG